MAKSRQKVEGNFHRRDFLCGNVSSGVEGNDLEQLCLFSESKIKKQFKKE